MSEQERRDLQYDMSVLARHGAGLRGSEQVTVELSTGFAIWTRDECVRRLYELIVWGER